MNKGMGDTMRDFAVFTPEIADGLIARGFRLKGYNKVAWFFEDSAQLRRAIEELIKDLRQVIK